jgi:hypothetical protein
MNLGKQLPLKTWLTLAGIIIVCLVFLSWCNARERAATADAEKRVATAQANAGANAAAISDEQAADELAGADVTARNREDIQGAENANDTAGAAGDAGLRALCGRVQYYDSQRCAQLRLDDRSNAPK